MKGLLLEITNNRNIGNNLIFSPLLGREILTENFLLQRNAEQELLDVMIPNEYTYEDEFGEGRLLPRTDLLPETRRDIDSILEILIDNPLYPQLIRCPQLSFRSHFDVIISFRDVLDIDRHFLGLTPEMFRIGMESLNVRLLIASNEDDEFMGCVWFYWKDDLCGIYGIRSSVVAYLTRKCHQGISISDYLLNNVLNLGKQIGCRKLVVPWPLPKMAELLRRKGFFETNNPDEDIMNFLAPVAGTHNVFSINL